MGGRGGRRLASLWFGLRCERENVEMGWFAERSTPNEIMRRRVKASLEAKHSQRNYQWLMVERERVVGYLQNPQSKRESEMHLNPSVREDTRFTREWLSV